MDSNLRPKTGIEEISYMFYTGTALVQFGHGLSYADFEINWDLVTPVLGWHHDAEVSDSAKSEKASSSSPSSSIWTEVGVPTATSGAARHLFCPSRSKI